MVTRYDWRHDALLLPNIAAVALQHDSSVRQVINTSAPYLANTRATSNPMPPTEQPVITMNFP